MTTIWAKYTSGPITFGVQLSEIDKTAADSDVDREHAAISFAVNENLSVSYGVSTVAYKLQQKLMKKVQVSQLLTLWDQ